MTKSNKNLIINNSIALSMKVLEVLKTRTNLKKRIFVSLYNNGREQGFRLTVYEKNSYKGKNVLFSEHRNSDSLVIYLNGNELELTNEAYNNSKLFYCYTNVGDEELYDINMIESAINYMMGYLES